MASHLKIPTTSKEPYSGLEHIPDLEPLQTKSNKLCDVLPLTIRVADARVAESNVCGFLHLPQGCAENVEDRNTTAVILLSGASGGVVGPSSIFLSLGDKLASFKYGIPVMRLDYRFPADTQSCRCDVLSAMSYLKRTFHLTKFVLVGWSFGSAPMFTVAAESPVVVGCAAIAGQTAGTSGIRKLSPRPVLLIHGTGDQRLPQRCSEVLYNRYGTKGNRKLNLFEGDDHALTHNSLRAEELLCDFITKCAGVSIKHA